MGMFNFSLSNLYSKAKDFVSDVYGGVKTGVGALKQAKDWVSEQLDKLSSIPYVGGIIQEGVDKVTNTPIPFLDGLSLRDIGKGLDYANSYINSPYILEGARAFDSVLSPALQQADSFLQKVGVGVG